MKAFYFDPETPEKVQLTERPTPTPQAGEVRVKVQAMALNRRDEWIRQGMYPGLQAAILGSDACGTVESLGEGVSETWLGKRVVINPNCNWGDQETHQREDYHILGMPTDGTFAEYVVVHEDRLAEAPAFLSNEEAAALPLAALTAFRATFTQGGVAEGKRVLITGFGGGVAQFAAQFALAAGARVAVSSGDESKLEMARNMGAELAVNYKDEGWDKAVKKHFGALDIAIDSAGGEGFSRILKILGRAGSLVFYGATTGLPPKVDLYRMFFNQIRIQGSTMGSDKEFFEMLRFVEKHQIKPVISSVRSFEDGLAAFDEMRDGGQFGKLVLKF